MDALQNAACHTTSLARPRTSLGKVPSLYDAATGAGAPVVMGLAGGSPKDRFGASSPAPQAMESFPARRYALPTKGTIAIGYDADFCLVDPSATWTVHAADSESTQEYTPFEGLELNARVTDTWVRGQHVLKNGVIVGSPTGRFLRRGTVGG